MFAFRVLDPTFGHRFAFPFEYPHRLHYDPMIGPGIVYPRVPHGPWTYEPHAQGRTPSSTFLHFGLGSSVVFTSGFARIPYFGLVFCFVFTSGFSCFL